MKTKLINFLIDFVSEVVICTLITVILFVLTVLILRAIA